MDSNDIDLKKRIDSDTGLRAKRKYLTIVALLMLGIQFSGAKLEEANTFILKFSFSHQNGIAFLLLMSILFLLVRYYNYAALIMRAYQEYQGVSQLDFPKEYQKVSRGQPA